MSFFKEAPTVSAVTVFSQLCADGSALTQAFNDSRLGYALGAMFDAPHTKLYIMKNGDRRYVPNSATQPALEDAEYAGKVLFFEVPGNPDAACSIRQSIKEIEEGTLGTSYEVYTHGRNGQSRTSNLVMTISGTWANGAGVKSPLKDVRFTDAQKVSGYNWQGLATLDLLLKSRPLARNPLWTAPKP